VDAALEAKPPDSADMVSGGSILVIDDEEANRMLLCRRLIRDGYSVQVADTGEAGLALAARESVDVILLDVMMPGISGYEVLARLKADGALREIPVLMITAVDGAESVTRCIALGADDYLAKPFDPVVLGARVRACVTRKRARDFELAYLRGVARVTAAAVAVETGHFSAASLDEVAQRPDALGNLARLFRRMAIEVAARQRRLEEQVQQLTIAIDDARKGAEVCEITESEYFRDLKARARDFSARRAARGGGSG
jgi:DNA-binding response OmpR family regulator